MEPCQGAPQALEVKDSVGRIPLLVAAESNASLEVLFLMLGSGPQTVAVGVGANHP